MAEYKAPVKDMQFALRQAAGIQQLASIPGFEEASEDMVAAILEEAAKLATDVIAPLNASGDQQGLQQKGAEVHTADGFKEAYQAFVDGGWGSLQFAEDYAGQGLPYVLSIAVMEMWQAANMAWGLCPLVISGGCRGFGRQCQ